MRSRFASACRAVLSVAGAVLFWGLLDVAQAALFDDDEARKQIAVERKRVDELNAQHQALNQRLARIEEALKDPGGKNQALLDLFAQIESLRLEISKLRGELEVINNKIDGASKRQRDMYVDLDARLRRIEQAGGAPPVAPGASSGAQPPVGDKPPASGSAAPPGTAGAPPAAVVAADTAEGRLYEMAQQQRRVGDYQGAVVTFQNFVKQYPKSTLAPRAQYWIGDSYYNMRDFKLAIASQQTLIKAYPDSSSVPDAMLNIASSQIEIGEGIAGRKTLEDLVAKYPVSEAAEKARRRLATAAKPAGAPSKK